MHRWAEVGHAETLIQDSSHTHNDKLSLCNTLYQIRTMWRLTSSGSSFFGLNLSLVSGKRLECLHSSTPESIQTDKEHTYSVHIVIYACKYIVQITSVHGVGALAALHNPYSERVSYFDCHNHMQIHGENLFLQNDYCNSISFRNLKWNLNICWNFGGTHVGVYGIRDSGYYAFYLASRFWQWVVRVVTRAFASRFFASNI